MAILDDSGFSFRDVRNGESLESRSVQTNPNSRCIAVAEDETTVALGHRDGTVVLHSDGDAPILTIAAHAGADGRVDGLAFSPDGMSLATACDVSNQVRVWDTSAGEMLADLEATEDCLAFSPDGSLMACIDYCDCVIFNTDTWQEVFRLTGHSVTITDVTFNSQGTLLATSSEDRKIIVWDTASWTQTSEINAHVSRIESIAFSPDGRTLASGATNGTIKLWHVELGQELFALERQPFPVIKLAFSPDGKQLFVQLEDGTMTVFETKASRHDAAITRTVSDGTQHSIPLLRGKTTALVAPSLIKE